MSDVRAWGYRKELKGTDLHLCETPSSSDLGLWFYKIKRLQGSKGPVGGDKDLLDDPTEYGI